MIWVYILVLVLALAGGWFTARTLPMKLVIVGSIALAGVGYFVLGKPNLGDQPYEARVAEIEKLATTEAGIASLTAPQLTAVFEKRAKQNPKDPMPHIFMGKLMGATGRNSEALLAFESALRRDPKSIEAMVSLGDLMFQDAGGPTPEATRQYRAALALQPDNLRIRFMVSMSDFEEGRVDEARAFWAQLGPEHFELVKEVADYQFKARTEVTPLIGELYRVANRLKPDDARIALMAGFALWNEGKKADAEKHWKATLARLSADDPMRGMYTALRQEFAPDTPKPGPSPSATPAN